MNKLGHFGLTTKNLRLLPLLAAVLLALSFPAQVHADYYVRAGASGASNGADWDNAYPSLPATLIRGETYWIAGGSYGAYAFNDAVSGSSYINVKKATISDHGTNLGWLSSYALGQAVFSNWTITSSYWYIDGGSTSSYGFSVKNPTVIDAAVHIVGSNLTNITIKSLSIDLTGAADSTRNVRVYAATGTYISNVLFSNIETKNSGNDCYAIFNMKDSVFEYLYLHSKVLTTFHGDGFEIGGGENVHIRYSRFNWNDQMIFWRGDFTSGSYHIYGNIFYDQPSTGKPIHSQSGNPIVGPVYIYNNTFVNVVYAIQAGGTGTNMTGEAKNNIFYKLSAGNSWGSITHDYNAADTNLGEANGQLLLSNPFVNSSTNNYHLSVAINPGYSSISTMYKTDPDGKTRGADGLLDRGAFEYNGTAKFPKFPPINSIQ